MTKLAAVSRLSLACAAVIFAQERAQAAGTTYTLPSDSSDAWESAAWTRAGGTSVNPFPNAASDIAQYLGNTAAVTALDLTGGGPITIGELFQNGTGLWRITTGTASGLVFDNTGGGGPAKLHTGAADLQLEADVTVTASNLVISTGTNQTGTINISGTIGGTGNILLNGARAAQEVMNLASVNHTGTLTVAVTDPSYTSTNFTIGSLGSSVTGLIVGDAANPTYGGTLNLNGPSTFNGPITLQGGATLKATTAGLSGETATGTITFGATGGTLMGSGGLVTARAMVLDGTGKIQTTADETITLNGAISGASGLSKTGLGGLVLGGATSNTYAGDTVVSGGGIAGVSNFFGQLSLQKTGGAVAVNGNLVLDAATSGSSVGIGTPMNTRNQFGQQFGPNTVITFSNTSTSNHAYLALYGTDQTVAGLSEPVASGGVVENSQYESVTVDSVLTINNSADYNFAGYLRNASGNGTGKLGIVKTGAGKQTFTGPQISYTGDTTINQGTLEMSGATGFASVVNFGVGSTGILSLASATQSVRGLASADDTANNAYVENGLGVNTVLTVNQGLDTTFGGILRDNLGGGKLSVTKTGGGTLTLSNYNTFTGPLTFNGGAVASTSNDFLGSPDSVLTFTGGSLRVLGTEFVALSGRTIANPTAGNSVSLDIANAANEFDLFQSIGGAGGLQKSGLGTLLVSSVNTYTGSTNITGGTLKMGIDDAISGTVSVTFGGTDPGTLQLNGFNLTVGTNINSGLNTANQNAVIENGSPIAATLTVLNGNDSTYAGLIRNGGIESLSFTRGGGSSTLTLTGANTYTGVTTLKSGVTAVTVLGAGGVASGIGAASSAPGNLVLDGGLLGYAGATAATTDRRFTLGVAGGGIDASGSTPAATLDYSSTQPISFTAATGARSLTLGGSNTGDNLFAAQIIDGSSTTGLIKQGAGTWVLTNANNSYTGATNITGGRLVTMNSLVGAGFSVSGGGALVLRGSGLSLGAATNTTGVNLLGGNATTRGSLDLVDGATNTVNILATSATAGLTLGGTVGNAAALNLEIGPAGAADLIALPAAKLVVNAGGARINITGLAGFGLGTYNLLSFGSGQATGLGSLYVGTTPDTTHSYSLRATATGEQLVVSDVFTSASWTNTGSGAWFTDSNWTGGVVPNGTGASATFGAVNAATATVTLDSGAGLGTLTISSPVSYVVAASAGSMLSFNNNGGTAAITTTAGSHTISAPLVLVNETDVTVGGTALTISGPIGGTSALVKKGAGTLTLSGTNNFIGGLVINAGTVQFAADTALGAVPANFTAGNVILNGGTLANTAPVNPATTRGFLLGPNGGTITAIAGNFTFGGVIADQSTPGMLTIGSGTGIYVAGGQSTYSGGTKIGPGASVVPTASSIGPAGAPTSGPLGTGIIDLAGGSIRATTGGTVAITLANAVNISGDTTFLSGGADRDLIFPGPVTLMNGTRTLTVNSNPATGFVGTTFNGVIGDGGNNYGLILAGTGRSVFGAANTFTGGLTIRSGTVTATNAGALGGSGTGAVTLGNSSGSAAATLFGSGAITFANPLTIQAGNTGLMTLGNTGAGAVVFSGPVALNKALNLASASTGSITLAGSIAGSGALTVTGSSGNFVQLSGTNTAYTGDVTVSSGTLRLGGGTALSASNGVTLSGGAILDLNNQSIALRSLAGAGNVTQNGVNGRVLTVGDASSATFSGNLTATTPANLALTKVGSGTLTLTGASTYTGATVVNGGTLALDLATNNSGVLAGGSPLTLGGGTLLVKGRTGSFTSTQSLGNLTLTAGTSSGITLVPNGGTSTTLTLGNTWTRGAGATLLVDLSAAGTSSLSSSPTLTNGILSYAAVKDATGLGFATVSGGKVVRFTTGTTLLPASNSSTTNFTTAAGDGTYPGGILALDPGAHATNSLSIDTSAASGILDVTGASLTFASGGLLMNGANTFTIQGGTVGASGAELVVQQFGTGLLTIASTVSGAAGSLTKAGSGVLQLDGTNAFTGATAVRGGILRAGAANTFSSGSAVSLSDAAGVALDLNGFNQTIASLDGGGAVGGNVTLGSATLTTGGSSSSTTFGGVISGAGALTKQGTGAFTLTNANTYSGLTTVSAGSLRITNASALGDAVGGTTVSANARLELAGGITVNNESVTINGSGGDNNGALRANGPGINTWVGNVVIGEPAARIGATGGGTLRISGAISGSNLNVRTESDLNTLIISGGSNTYSGATNLVVGVLKLEGGNNRLPTGTTVGMGNGSNVGTALFDLNGQNQQVNALVSVTGATTMPMEVTSAAPATLTVTANTSTQTYLGKYTGALALTKNGGSTYSLGGSNTYSGATTLNGGTLLAGAAGAFSASSAFTLANTAGVALNLNGFNQSIGSLAGGGATGGNVTLGSATLTTGGNNSSTSFGGSISGTGGVTKQGTGTFALTGTGDYTGPTIINGGVLEVSGSLNGSTAIAATGGTLRLSADQAVNNPSANLTLGAAGVLDVADALNGSTQTFGSLNVIGNAAIDFGSVTFGLGNTLSFTDFTMGNSLLSITNWTGATGTTANPNTDPNQDRFVFSTLSLTDQQLASISFYNDTGSFLGTGAAVSFSGGYEIVPVPEPSSLALLGLGGLLAGRRFRRRRAC